ncbi:hypothetical protein U9M48_042046 [Paspalum notatum var. saurae]|uniref:Uncharacterized protein n=1 Tax=Paspalum notatum var. saurae TaxID=547442 RepID=A0AAQ3UQK6_PASNO
MFLPQSNRNVEKNEAVSSSERTLPSRLSSPSARSRYTQCQKRHGHGSSSPSFCIDDSPNKVREASEQEAANGSESDQDPRRRRRRRRHGLGRCCLPQIQEKALLCSGSSAAAGVARPPGAGERCDGVGRAWRRLRRTRGREPPLPEEDMQLGAAAARGGGSAAGSHHRPRCPRRRTRGREPPPPTLPAEEDVRPPPGEEGERRRHDLERLEEEEARALPAKDLQAAAGLGSGGGAQGGSGGSRASRPDGRGGQLGGRWRGEQAEGKAGGVASRGRGPGQAKGEQRRTKELFISLTCGPTPNGWLTPFAVPIFASHQPNKKLEPFYSSTKHLPCSSFTSHQTKMKPFYSSKTLTLI